MAPPQAATRGRLFVYVVQSILDDDDDEEYGDDDATDEDDDDDVGVEGDGVWEVA